MLGVKLVAGMMVVKVETMDAPSFYQPGTVIFMNVAQAFHHIPDRIRSFEVMPD